MRSIQRRRSGGRRIAIVSYHRVVEDFEGELRRSIPGLLVSKETFRRHLEEAHAAGYRFATIDQALEALAGTGLGNKDLFVVTFDDGYRDAYLHAVPVLERMGVPAIFYLSTGLVGTGRRLDHDRLYHLARLVRARRLRPLYAAMPAPAAALIEPVLSGRSSISAALDRFISEHPAREMGEVVVALEAQLGGGQGLLPEQGELLSWEEARRMAARGFQLGAHTSEHVVLTHEPRERVDAEIAASKEAIERETGHRVQHFAYCNGWYSDEVVRSLVRQGFRSAVTTEDLPNVVGGDPFALRRGVLWENFSLGMLGDYSPSLTACQLDGIFGMLGLRPAVIGRRPPRRST
ncbi:MAG: polysaccharide deacetylase family protein [Myxococcales bacterium]|nr:polysaccharide deacetylase family protein [Myxococcales bacterium]